MGFVENTLFNTMPCLGEKLGDHSTDGQDQQSSTNQRNDPESSEWSQSQYQDREHYDFA